jgi:hypothetical protein
MAMKDDQKEKVWLYGKLLIDFANSETSDEAGLTYIANIKKSFGFSDKVKRFIEDRDIPHEFEGFSTLSGIQSKFDENANQLEKPEIPREKIKKPLKDGDIIINQAKIPSERFSVVDDSASIDQMVMEEHSHIDSLKNDLYACIKHISKLRNPPECSANGSIKHFDEVKGTIFLPLGPLEFMDVVEGLDDGSRTMFYFLDKYNQIPTSLTYVALGSDGCFHAKITPIFEADYFLNRYDRYASDFLTEYYDKPIAYCLIEFLRDNEAVHRLKICPYCEKFFLARDKKRIKCYKDKCRKMYEQEKKKKQRSDDPVTYL